MTQEQINKQGRPIDLFWEYLKGNRKYPNFLSPVFKWMAVDWEHALKLESSEHGFALENLEEVLSNSVNTNDDLLKEVNLDLEKSRYSHLVPYSEYIVSLKYDSMLNPHDATIIVIGRRIENSVKEVVQRFDLKVRQGYRSELLMVNLLASVVKFFQPDELVISRFAEDICLVEIMEMVKRNFRLNVNIYTAPSIGMYREASDFKALVLLANNRVLLPNDQKLISILKTYYSYKLKLIPRPHDYQEKSICQALINAIAFC